MTTLVENTQLGCNVYRYLLEFFKKIMFISIFKVEIRVETKKIIYSIGKKVMHFYI